MTIKIITDSAANWYQSDINGIPHSVAPLTILVNQQPWLDDGTIDQVAFAKALQTTSTKTSSSCPNIGEWLAAYEGADEIYVITITSGLSGSYNAAQQAATTYLQDHPDVKIHVFDSRSAGPQERLLAMKLADYLNAGKSFEEVVPLMEQDIQATDLFFVLADLTNLANNGRINPAVAKVATLMNFRLYGTADDQGKLQKLGQVRGGKKMYTKLVDALIEQGYQGGKMLIDHADGLAAAEKYKSELLSRFPDAEITISECGALCSYYAEAGGVMFGFEK